MPWPTPLVGVGDLARRLDDLTLRVVDVRWYLGDPGRGRAEYEAGHVPGAAFLDLDVDLSDHSVEDAGRHPLPGRDAFAATLGGVGIGNEHHVVAYDASGGSVAARLWWMLRWLGHERVSVLDGGWPAWIDQGHPVAVAGSPHPPSHFVAGAPLTRVVDRIAVASRSGVLLDARAPERWRGDVEPVDPVAGHIPGSVNVPSTALLDATHRFLAPGALRSLLVEAGTGPGTIASCGSGVTACALVLAAVAAGLPEPALYPGSFSEWSTAGLPTEP
jgi:thiosulfate/3-mercaptopyruvate sulfurtransferase